MLDILIPTHLPNLRMVPKCISAIDRHRPNVPMSLTVAVDGVTKTDCGELEEFLADRIQPEEPSMVGRLGSYQMPGERPPREKDWRITSWPSLYFQDVVMNVLSSLRGELVLVLPPWIEIADRRWFGKLQQPLVFDPHAALVSLPSPETPQGTLPPAKFDRRKHPTTEAVLSRRKVLMDLAPRMGPVRSPRGWVAELSRVAEERGCTRWMASAVRYLEIRHEEWLKPESSGIKEKDSGSPSRTTRVLSTPTTTDSDGDGVSSPF